MQFCKCHCNCIFKYIYSLRYYRTFISKPHKVKNEIPPSKSKETHCYKQLFPWKNQNEFSEHLASCIVYNKDGLIAINKPFGIKIHGHDKPGTRYNKSQRFIIPSISDCDFTIEDSLPFLKDFLNVPELTIMKSAEKYSSGLVLLSSSESTCKRIKKSFDTAKAQKKPHLIHWAITVGYPVVPYRQERVGIKFSTCENSSIKEPIIETSYTKKSCKQQRVHSVHVEYRIVSSNEALCSSLIQIACSAVAWHFVRVYASSRAVPILGDIMYGSRMKFLLGVPVKVQLENARAYNKQLLPETMCERLNISKVGGHSSVPTMLHLKNILLPNFVKKDEDLIIDAKPPYQFQWTAEKLNLL